ncbi:MAG TPA: tripartite tricarboxylate transporter TctB family protein [Devosiaceae bacterium]|jgi:hypothetical protein|nr:tripartite tricarboxylate transporter TctB family protein [Devosiaceae bacterium]
MTINLKDLAAGALFVIIGLFFALDALFNLRIGQAFSMGPGYFPLVLGAVLVGLGLVIAMLGLNKPSESFGRVSWRGLLLVIGAVIFFAATIRGLGMVLSLGGATLMASLASGRMSWRGAALLSILLTGFCVLAFIYALRLPYPLFGGWITG